jgi:hypothetical protein
MVQLVQDYKQYYGNNREQTTEDDSTEIMITAPMNKTLENIALTSGTKVEDTILRSELKRIIATDTTTEKNVPAPKIVAPIMMVPTWSIISLSNVGGMSTAPQSSLSDPRFDWMKAPYNSNLEPFPLFVHAKYSKLFCGTNPQNEHYQRFAKIYGAMVQSTCMDEERVAMLSSSYSETSCWSTWLGEASA